jgi:hypothetical protein
MYDELLNEDTSWYETYSRCLLVEVTWEQEAPQDTNDPWTYLDIRGTVAGEYLTIQATNAYWETPGEPVKQPLLAATAIIPELEWTVTWPFVTLKTFRDVMTPKFRDAFGKVNSSPFDLLFKAPAETIMFVGYDFEEVGFDSELNQMDAPITSKEKWSDRNYVRIDAKFLEKRVGGTATEPYGHNHFWNPDKGWQRLYVNNAPPFASYDMNKFFQRPGGAEPNA